MEYAKTLVQCATSNTNKSLRIYRKISASVISLPLTSVVVGFDRVELDAAVVAVVADLQQQQQRRQHFLLFPAFID